MKPIYYLQPAPTGNGFILFRDAFEQPVKTIEFALSYVRFGGGQLVVVDEFGRPVRTLH